MLPSADLEPAGDVPALEDLPGHRVHPDSGFLGLHGRQVTVTKLWGKDKNAAA